VNKRKSSNAKRIFGLSSEGSRLLIELLKAAVADLESLEERFPLLPALRESGTFND